MDGDGHVTGVLELIDGLHARGVIRASFHENGQLHEILLPPPKQKDGAKKSDADPRAAKREHYEVLLNRRVLDAELDGLPD